MTTTSNITVFCFIVWFALYNGFTLRWSWETDPWKKQKLSKLWHQVGALVRVTPIPFIVYSFFHDWGNMAVILAWYCVFCWPLFDIVLNLSRGLPWWYKGSTKSGTGSLMDILMSTTVYWILKTLFVLSSIAITILFLLHVI